MRNSLFSGRLGEVECGDGSDDHKIDPMHFGKGGGLIRPDLLGKSRTSIANSQPHLRSYTTVRLALLAVSPFLTILSAPTITASTSSCWKSDPTMVSQIMQLGICNVDSSSEVNREPWW